MCRSVRRTPAISNQAASQTFLCQPSKIASCHVPDVLTQVSIFSDHTHTHSCIYSCVSVCMCVCVCLYDINPSRKYKRVSSAAIQSPPPPLGLSTPNIMSFILSVKIINYYDRWLISSLDFEQTVTVFFSRPKNICTFSNKIDALSPHCFLNVKCICNDTRCLMYRYVRSIKITKLQHAVVLSEN